MPGCFPVSIVSDSEGRFGHNCPRCGKYWRSGPWPNICPYCATQAHGYEFLSEAQLRYVSHYCKVLSTALNSAQAGEVVIDMDEVAEAVGKQGEKPAFYISEQSQQCRFHCPECGEFNDILGRFGYCSACGTRNDLADFETKTIASIRERLNAGDAAEDCLRDAVAAFDSFVGQIANQLADLVPLTERRRNRLTKQRFYDLVEVRQTFGNWFDIDLFARMREEECSFVTRMFYRRHVYEHKGGEVDQKYLDDSGDASVRLKQHIHETQHNVHRLLASLVKMARNAHRAFHELFPPIPGPIEAFKKKKEDMERWARENPG